VRSEAVDVEDLPLSVEDACCDHAVENLNECCVHVLGVGTDPTVVFEKVASPMLRSGTVSVPIEVSGRVTGTKRSGWIRS
jgi:hypothetical protein